MRSVRQPLRRLPLAVVAEVKDRLDQLESEDIIEKVRTSRKVSPLVVGSKRDGRVNCAKEHEITYPNTGVKSEIFRYMKLKCVLFS